MTPGEDANIKGWVAPGFEPVRDAFERNFTEHGDHSAAVSAYHRGMPVVDLWGGTYEQDSLQLVFSTTKGMTTICALMLADRGLLDIDAPVATYWPEFAASGKGAITVRALLDHTAGLAGVDDPLTLEEFLAWDPVVERLAAQPPNWEPGTARGYHTVTFGFLVGEVIRRVTGDTVGGWFAREVAKPLALDLWIGLPPGVEPRVAPLLDFLPTEEISDFYTALLTPGTMTYRAFMNPGLAILTFNDPAMHAAELPAVNGITDARSLARLYAACIGPVDGIRLLEAATVDEARREQSRGPDLVLVDRDEVANGLGFMLPDDVVPMAGAGSFGHPGLGGSIAFANPELDLAFGYVMDQCLDFGPHRDPRSADLAEAVVRCL